MKINNYIWENDLSLNDLVLKQKEEIERLNNIIKEAREYAGELRLYDNESIEFEISTKLLEILDKENK